MAESHRNNKVTVASVKGGSFLFTRSAPGDIFTPEDITPEQMAVMKTAHDFNQDEVKPVHDKLLHINPPLLRELMLKAGVRGLLGVDIDKEYGGRELDKIASTLAAAASAGSGVFSLTWNAHAGIGTLPIVIFGNEAQKKKYLPGLASGATISAYALTEPGAGSDALGIKTRADLSPDGKHYILNGEKLFISNAGVAGIFITYARIGGDKFTAFIVERDYPGVKIGPEVEKMGIRGSSTCAVFFRDVKVPVENVLYEVGRGHEVAFCILDLGRFRLAAACVESGKIAIEHSVKWAKHREQFGKSLSGFGLIRQKLAEMTIRTYIMESVVYRTTGLLEQAFSGVDKKAPDYGKRMYGRISEYTVEDSISKVLGSEALSYIVDEAVQLYGGRGYIEGNPAERMYRDSRINRIFEGTNEINRLLLVRWLLRKAVAGDNPLFSRAKQLKGELPVMKAVSPGAQDGALGYEEKLIEMAKNIFILLCGLAALKYRDTIEGEEEILGYLADILIEILAMESGLLRAMKSAASAGEEKAALKIDMARVYINDALTRVENCAVNLVTAMETGDALTAQLGLLRKLLSHVPVNTVSARRRIAAAVIESESYVC